MRRGHLGIGGWRSENTRHYRPRGGGNPHYRPRGYPLLDTPRFPPPTRSYRPAYASRSSHSIDQSEEQNRNKYRFDNRNNRSRPYEKHNDRQIYPQLQRFRHSDAITHSNTYKEPHYYDKPSQSDGSYVNSHGDIDHRQSNVAQSHLPFQKQIPTSWVLPGDHKTPQYDDRNLNKSYRHLEDASKTPLLDYPGHRPPSSDHYGGNPTPTIDNSNSFSRSVDDTVNIVRKRLLNRNESLITSDSMSTDSSNPDIHRDNLVNRYNDIQQEPPVRRQVPKQGLKKKSNCDKIKNKIVHQLFKMDKEKIHKLMDNPNSSSKFEYAINSLITESQNSFNRHLRSVAEKSLCSSSTDFMENDNNTIYEDTFLKQMQCLLDPQDTVFLEDIKPIVMAELNKVLQLDDIEQHITEEESSHFNDLHLNYNQCDTTFNNSDNYPEDYSDNIYSEPQHLNLDFQSSHLNRSENEIFGHCDKNKMDSPIQANPLFVPRQRTKSCTFSEEKVTSSEITRYGRLSLDNQSTIDIYKDIDDPSKLFSASTEHLSEDEDPFADLDNQYHVAVDHNFISTEDTYSPQQTDKDSQCASTTAEIKVNTVDQNLIKENNIKQEIDTQILDIAKSPLELSLNFNRNTDPNKQDYSYYNKKQQSVQLENINMVSTAKNDEIYETLDNRYLEPDKSSNTCDIPTTLKSFNSLKRPIDQQTPHRKEKRKKIESTPPDLTKKVNKDDVSNSSDNILKTPEKPNVSNSKSDTEIRLKGISKETKNLGIDDKEYSDKYVKRKNNQNKHKAKNNEPEKIHNPNSSNHSHVNNKNDSVSNVNQTATKLLEGKSTLKTIDMFIEKPKKVNIHQAHRNTAIVPSTSNIIPNLDKIKKKRGSIRKRKGLKRHIATQVFRRFLTKETQTVVTKSDCSRFCQTEDRVLCTQGVQTEPMHEVKQDANSTDPFERMKEIDLEIQVLLQEKFKLYSSLDNKDSTSQNSLQTLGMTVLNVTPFEDDGKIDSTDGDTSCGDAIIDDFTNIPVEELEQIALESVQSDSNESFHTVKRSRRQVVLEQERKSSVSPKTNKKNLRKVKTPNITLIEQIITDERPLEDIIGLDELEKPLKTRSRTQKVQSTKKRANKKSKSIKTIDCDTSDEANIFNIKECSVVLVREDLNKLLVQNTFENYEYQELYEPIEYSNFVGEVEIVEKDSPEINDIQFDMLDVSEDIVIGDNCEVKSIQDKELEIIEIPINEEIILESQSSEEISAPQTNSGDCECKMYDYSADENLRRGTVTVTGNADAVLAIECIENNFIAACLDGNVYYFSGDGQLINTLRGSNLAVTCLTIVKEKYGTTVYTGSLDSRIRYYDLETGIEKGPECNVLSPIQTMDRAWDTVFVGTRTGFVLQFECKNNMLIPVSTVKFSDQSILALRAMKEGPRKVLLVAARSENVTIKDAQTGLLLRTLAGPKMTVYTLLYEDGKVYCGTSSHQIQVFDYTSGAHVGAHEGGKGAVCLRASGGLLFAGCYDGCVYVYREGGARPMAQLRGPGLMLLSLAVVGSKIIAGYKDRSLYIWKIPLSILQEMIL